METARGVDYCGVMLDQEGPFSVCLGRTPSDGYLESCVIDVCVHAGDVIQMKAQACNAITALATECAAQGVTVGNWSFVSCGRYKKWYFTGLEFCSKNTF